VSPAPPGPGGAGPRIAYVLGSTAGGTGTHVAMLAAGCAARGMAVAVFGPAGTAVAAPLAVTAVEIGGRPRPARDAAAVARLRRLLRGWAPDVVHAHGLRAGAFAALALAGQPGALVVTVHNAPPAGRVNGAVYAALARLAARRADAMTWVSADIAARMRRAGARDGGRAVVAARAVTPPGPAAVATARASLGGPGRPVVFAAGRLAAQKGFAVLIDAAARWQGHDPVPLVAIAGEGPLAGALAGRAAAAHADVLFLGRRGDVPALLAAADVVVVPSAWEGQPLVVQEALRAGRPLVATRAGGIPDLTGADAALLVPAGDAAALARAVLSVLDDPGRAVALSAAAAVRAAALPGAADAVDSALALYHRVTRHRAGQTDSNHPYSRGADHG